MRFRVMTLQDRFFLPNASHILGHTGGSPERHGIRLAFHFRPTISYSRRIFAETPFRFVKGGSGRASTWVVDLRMSPSASETIDGESVQVLMRAVGITGF